MLLNVMHYCKSNIINLFRGDKVKHQTGLQLEVPVIVIHFFGKLHIGYIDVIPNLQNTIHVSIVK